MEPFNATPEEAEELIWWLVYLLGGRVTIPTDDEFWDNNLPEHRRLSVGHDDQGNPVLLAEQQVWSDLT